MKIENAQMLQTQMNIGSNFTVDKHGDINTQGALAKGFQNFIDLFQSAAKIAARNEKLMTAMGAMLRTEGAQAAGGAVPLNGPQNLANPPALEPEVRGALIQNTAKALAQGHINAHVAKQFPNADPQSKALMSQHLGILLTKNIQQGNVRLPNSLDGVKKAMQGFLRSAEANNVDTLNTLKAFKPFTLNNADTTTQKTFLKNQVMNSVKEDISESRHFHEFGFHNSYIKDADRNTPSIGGERTTRENYRENLKQFSANIVEQRVISSIASQMALVPLTLLSITGVPGGFNPNGGTPSPLQTGVTHNQQALGEQGNYSITRQENGDVTIQTRMSVGVLGVVDDVSYPNTPTGVCSYAVTIKADQFRAFDGLNAELDAIDAKHNLNTNEGKKAAETEKHALMMARLANYTPNVEVSHLSVTPRTDTLGGSVLAKTMTENNIHAHIAANFPEVNQQDFNYIGGEIMEIFENSLPHDGPNPRFPDSPEKAERALNLFLSKADNKASVQQLVVKGHMIGAIANRLGGRTNEAQLQRINNAINDFEQTLPMINNTRIYPNSVNEVNQRIDTFLAEGNH